MKDQKERGARNGGEAFNPGLFAAYGRECLLAVDVQEELTTYKRHDPSSALELNGRQRCDPSSGVVVLVLVYPPMRVTPPRIRSRSGLRHATIPGKEAYGAGAGATAFNKQLHCGGASTIFECWCREATCS